MTPAVDGVHKRQCPKTTFTMGDVHDQLPGSLPAGWTDMSRFPVVAVMKENTTAIRYNDTRAAQSSSFSSLKSTFKNGRL